MTPVHFTISGCSVTDGAAIARNNMSAFWQDPHYVLEWKHRTLEYHIDQASKRMPFNLVDDDRTTKRHQKAVDSETGRLLGYARWKIPPSHATNGDGTLAWPEAVLPPVSQEEEAEIRRVADTAVWDCNTEVDDLLGPPVQEMRKEVLAKKDYMRLDYLAVHPESQGKGVGTALIQSGIKEAESLGLDLFIQAYEAGVSVYKSLGFRIEKELVQDDSMFGGPGKFAVYFMLRENPKS